MKHYLALFLLTALSLTSYAQNAPTQAPLPPTKTNTAQVQPTTQKPANTPATAAAAASTEQSNVIKEDLIPPPPEGPLPVSEINPLFNSEKPPQPAKSIFQKSAKLV